MSAQEGWRGALGRALDAILGPEQSRRRRVAARRRGTNSREKHVLPDPDGEGWIVRSAGAVRASSHHHTQHAAIERARAVLRKAGGGELVVHNAEGRIRDRETVEGSRRGATGRR